jgi:hypothetical protein
MKSIVRGEEINKYFVTTYNKKDIYMVQYRGNIHGNINVRI